MGAAEDLATLEQAFGFSLPTDYRLFLLRRAEDALDPPLQFELAEDTPRGRSVLLSQLYTAGTILENDRRGASCDADKQMLLIGSDFMGGYLYLSYAPTTLGQVFFREPYVASTYYKAAGSFGEFLRNTRPDNR